MTQNAVEEFHHRLRTKQDERIFADAAPEFRNSMSREESQTFFEKVRMRLGAPELTQRVSISINHSTSGQFLVCQYQTRFRNGEARESFTWRVENGRLALTRYFINSPLMSAE